MHRDEIQSSPTRVCDPAHLVAAKRAARLAVLIFTLDAFEPVAARSRTYNTQYLGHHGMGWNLVLHNPRAPPYCGKPVAKAIVQR